MCPSYMVTHEEEHTDARAGAPALRDAGGGRAPGLPRSRGARVARPVPRLQGGKGECPVHVDMATYKAEFLSHYYARRLRPRAAYDGAHPLVGPPRAARAGAREPRDADARARGGGEEDPRASRPRRSIRRSARTSFERWFQGRPRRNAGGPQVVLWPDTFNDHFFPGATIAATEVIGGGPGYEVIVPEQEALLRPAPLRSASAAATAPAAGRDERAARPVERGVPVGSASSPSCVSVFRDELHGLFPDDPLATKLRQQTHMFGDFLKGAAGAIRPSVARRAADCRASIGALWCTATAIAEAILEMDAERDVLHGLGLDIELLDSGCCGMAGAFGFEEGAKYDVSIRCGERVLLPAVRSAPARRADRGRRLQLPRAESSGRPTGRRCTSRPGRAHGGAARPRGAGGRLPRARLPAGPADI